LKRQNGKYKTANIFTLERPMRAKCHLLILFKIAEVSWKSLFYMYMYIEIMWVKSLQLGIDTIFIVCLGCIRTNIRVYLYFRYKNKKIPYKNDFMALRNFTIITLLFNQNKSEKNDFFFCQKIITYKMLREVTL